MKMECSDAAKSRLAEMEEQELTATIEKIMEAQRTQVAGSVFLVREEWVRSALSCSISATETGLIAIFRVGMPEVPREVLQFQAFEKIEDLLVAVCEGGFRKLEDVSGFKTEPVKGFSDLFLVRLTEEEGGCGGDCQCHKIIGGGDGQQPGEGNELFGPWPPWPAPAPVTPRDIAGIGDRPGALRSPWPDETDKS